MNAEKRWIEAEIAHSKHRLAHSLRVAKDRAPYAFRDCVQKRPYLSVGAAALIGFAAMGLAGSSSSASRGATKTSWSRLAFRGARLLGTLLPGLVGAKAIKDQADHHDGA